MERAIRRGGIVLAVGICAWLWSPGARADGIQLEPGKWKIVQKMTSPLIPNPQVRVVHSCVENEEFSPEDLMRGDEQECRFSDVKVEGSTMKWKVECARTQASGEGEFSSQGHAASGRMSMEMNVQGRDLSFSVDWNAERVGEC